jgi:hypothetical protein
MILAGVIGLMAAPWQAGAETVSIIDTTNVIPYYHKAPYPSYTPWNNDIIAKNPSAWDIKKVDVTWSGAGLEMQIFTNYQQTGEEGAGQADIALGNNGTFSYGIAMSSHDGVTAGHIYAVSTWKTPDDIWGGSSSNYIYGGRYGSDSDPQMPFTLIDTTTMDLGLAVVNYILADAGSISKYIVEVIFPDNFNADGAWNDFIFQVKSGTCSNEIEVGEANRPVPLPPSAFLLGSALVGLLLLGRRRKPE